MPTQEEINLSKSFGGTGILTSQQQAAVNQAQQAFTPPSIIPMQPTTAYTPDVSNITSQNDANKVIADFYKSKAEQEAKDKAAAEAVQATKPKSWKDWLTSSGNQSPQDFATSQYSAIGYNPTEYFADLKASTALIDSLNKDLNNTIAIRDKQIADISGAGGGMDFQNNAVAQINRNANVVIGQKEGNINAQTALMNAKQGNFTQAQNFVNTAVNAYTAQLTTDFNMTQKFYDDNQTLIQNLGSKYDTDFTNYINTLQNGLTQAKTDKTNILNLMIANPKAGIDPNVDTYETAQLKVAKYSVANPTYETPDTKEVNGSLYQFNNKTGQWTLAIGSGNSGNPAWNAGAAIIKANPTKSRADLEALIRQDPVAGKMTDGDINSLLETSTSIPLNDTNYDFISKYLTSKGAFTFNQQSYNGLGYSKEDAKNYINAGQISVGGKVVTLTEDQKNKINTRITGNPFWKIDPRSWFWKP